MQPNKPLSRSLSNKTPKRSILAFTLVELMVVVAIIGILMIVALPAYNNYSLKSKFSEVVLATAPTKTAISTCAVSGDCVSGGSIALSTTTGGGPPTVPQLLTQLAATPNTSQTPINRNPALLYAMIYQSQIILGHTPADANTYASSYATSVAAGSPSPYIVEASPSTPGDYCWATTNSSSCTGFSVTPAQIQASMTADTNPFYSYVGGSSTTTMANLPCVGGSGCSPATKYAASVSYDATGIITATAQTTSGLKAETFVLAPALSGGRVDWSASGTCKTRAGGALC